MLLLERNSLDIKASHHNVLPALRILQTSSYLIEQDPSSTQVPTYCPTQCLGSECSGENALKAHSISSFIACTGINTFRNYTAVANLYRDSSQLRFLCSHMCYWEVLPNCLCVPCCWFYWHLLSFIILYSAHVSRFWHMSRIPFQFSSLALCHAQVELVMYVLIQGKNKMLIGLRPNLWFKSDVLSK